MVLNFQDFDFVRRLVQERSGIAMDAAKQYLVEARLIALVRREGFASVPELVARLRAERSGGLGCKVVDSMTTNETFFFREPPVFDALRGVVLPTLRRLRAAERVLRFWCAACSSGQEAYSIAMVLREEAPRLDGWQVSILATDLSDQMLARAEAGLYSQLEVNRGLSAPSLAKHFERVGSDWRVREEIRRMVEFRKLNLVAPWPPLPRMDVVFMRNVMIYFGLETRLSILRNTRRSLRPDGYLFVGSAESPARIDEAFASIVLGKARAYRVVAAQGGL